MFLKNRKEYKNALAIMRKYVVGEMTTEDFWEVYKNNIVMQRILIRDRKRPDESILKINADNMLSVIDITKFSHRTAVHRIVANYFRRRKEKLNYFNAERNLLSDFYAVFPSYADTIDIDRLYEMWLAIPADVPDNQKIKYLKNKLKELFVYKKRRPQWIQNADWPIVDGVPYVFDHQETASEGYEKYYFYDPKDETKQIIVEQCE
ncbi:MAG: hypothetical protein J1F65_02205 [Clostridiales bacterium]|nr:hypothetical protein [Clostridiales bacterium]